MIEMVVVLVCERETHSVCQRGDEEGLNFRLGRLLYSATASTEGQCKERKAQRCSLCCFVMFVKSCVSFGVLWLKRGFL